MLKRTTFILIVFLLFVETQVFAYSNETYNNVIRYEYRLGQDSPFSNMDVLVPIFNSNVYRVVVVRPDGSSVEHTNFTNGESFGLSCNRTYTMRSYDSNNNFLGTDTVTVTNLIREYSNCSANDPPPPTDPDNPNNCGCIFTTPGWNDYMGKIDEIINRIPPPPNWENVSNIFYENVVPRFINDLSNMLGTAPTPPTLATITPPNDLATPQLPRATDRGINNKKPTFTEPEGLKESTFNLNDLKDQAEQIHFEEDNTGGFNIVNPIDALPDLPTDNFPSPGATNPGEYGEHKPEELEIETPQKEDETIEFPSPPKEDLENPIPETPPNPNDDITPPADPNNDFNAPTPDLPPEDNTGSIYYKESPDD